MQDLAGDKYLLQSFLCFNREFEVMLDMDWIMTEHIFYSPEPFHIMITKIQQAISGSFWIRRMDASAGAS